MISPSNNLAMCAAKFVLPVAVGPVITINLFVEIRSSYICLTYGKNKKNLREKEGFKLMNM